MAGRKDQTLLPEMHVSVPLTWPTNSVSKEIKPLGEVQVYQHILLNFAFV